jgi:hypothetical protein
MPPVAQTSIALRAQTSIALRAQTSIALYTHAHASYCMQAAFVWTWAKGEPKKTTGDCVAQLPTGRWAVQACATAQQLPLACRAVGDDRIWTVAKASDGCAEGYVAVPPTNGFANAHLRAVAASTDTAGLVWLNVSINGLGPAPGLAYDGSACL